MSTALILVMIAGLIGLAVVLRAFHRHEMDARAIRLRDIDALTRSRALAQSDLALLRTDLTLHSSQLAELSMMDPELAQPMQEYLTELAGSVDELATELAMAGHSRDIQQATQAMSHTRQALATLTSILLAEPSPPVRPPCFFNPNHGPSSTIVVWTGEDDRPVRVPCCAADAERLRSGAAPYSRTVAADGVRVPWWQAGPTVRPWAMGWFHDWLTSSASRTDLGESFPSLFAEELPRAV